MKLIALISEYYKKWTNEDFTSGGLTTLLITPLETNFNFTDCNFIDITMSSMYNGTPNKNNTYNLRIHINKYKINIVNGIDDFIKFAIYPNTGLYGSSTFWQLTRGGKLTQTFGNETSQRLSIIVDFHIRGYKELDVTLNNQGIIYEKITEVYNEPSQLANMYAENVQVQKDVLKELKNQSINLEVQGRFLAQSTRMWATDAVLGNDEYQNAKLQVMEENL